MVNALKGIFYGSKKEELPAVQEQQDSDTQIKTVKYDEYIQMASNGLEQIKEKSSQLIGKAKECDETQHKVIYAGRAVLDATAIFLGPVGGAVGGVVGYVEPETTKLVCDKINKATEGVWNDLSFENKLIGLGSGVGLGILTWYVYVPILAYVVLTVANIYAAKRCADFAIQPRIIGELRSKIESLEKGSEDEKNK